MFGVAVVSGLIARVRSLWRAVQRRSQLESEMNEEFRAHVELRASDLVRAGLTRSEALRQARREFGSTERYKEEARASRGLRHVDGLRFSWLDFKLGLRMLGKYPGLTIVGGFALAFAIWGGAGAFEFINRLVYPRLPLPDGDRIVMLRNWNLEANRPVSRVLHDFLTWRAELRSVEQIGAAQLMERNLILAGAEGAAVEVAEITASAFALTRVRPLLGRTLIESDEQASAPAVLLIGYELWQTRFGGDANVLGRTVRLGATQATVVGVMPKGYGFPVAQQLWVPLRESALEYERLRGPSLIVFGRLAEGVTMEQAQAELAALGRRTSADFPQTHQHLRPQVQPYAKVWLNLSLSDVIGVMSFNLIGLFLLVLICANVALLMFARAATRESEIIVRNALGASRGRIVLQLFTEALVLCGLAALLGLATASLGLRWALGVFEAELMDSGTRLPFWMTSGLSPATVLYALLLVFLAAALAGVLPALKITRGLSARLKQVTAGGGGLHFGGIWTAVIVAQVAVTVAFPAVAFFVRKDTLAMKERDPGFADEAFLSARLEQDRDARITVSEESYEVYQQRFASTVVELEERLRADPAVLGVTFGRRLPRMYHEWNQIEVDAGAVEPPDARGHRVGKATIGIDYFDVLGTPILSGRQFHSGDLAADARVVIVSQPFVDRVLGGRNPIGRRIRYLASESDRTPRIDGEWYEIVGVAPDLGMTSGYGSAGVYHPLARGAEYPIFIAIHLRGQPAAFAPRLRELALAIDPTLRLNLVRPLNEVINTDLKVYSFWFKLTVAVCAIALLLSLTGIYAVMSFTVARRTREIGIRVALGADARRIARAIFWRPIAQVGIGIVLGSAFVALMVVAIAGGLPSARQVSLVTLYGVLMMAVCMLACVVPTRRALSVQPTDALKTEG